MSLHQKFAQYLLSLTFLVCAGTGQAAEKYHVIDRIPLDGDGGWDYLTADSTARRLYVTHNSQVQVLDLDTQEVVGSITNLTHVHGVTIATPFGRGFISDGGANAVIVFDLKSLAIQMRIPVGENPDGIVYEPVSRRVFVFNGKGHSVSAIDAATGAVVATVALGGKPEFPVSDGAGRVYVNIEDTSEIVQLDANALTLLTRWPLAPCEEPTGLALDKSGQRLFSVCSNKKMQVLDAKSGHNIASLPIGDHCDAVTFDAQQQQIFTSNGAGSLTQIKQIDVDHYQVQATINTERSGRTLALDTTKDRIYISAAVLEPAPAATAATPKPRPGIVAGSFHLILVGHLKP